MALSDPRFVRSVDHWADYQNGRVPEGWPLLGTIPTDNTNMLALDGAPHRRLRQLTAAALDDLEPRAGAPDRGGRPLGLLFPWPIYGHRGQNILSLDNSH